MGSQPGFLNPAAGPAFPGIVVFAMSRTLPGMIYRDLKNANLISAT
jgi:hypothetical protein